MPLDRLVAELRDWIVDRATETDDLAAILGHVTQRLVADAGLPVMRAIMTMPVIDPSFRAVMAVWDRRRGAYEEHAEHGPESDAEFAVSPIHYLLQAGLEVLRLDIGAGEGTDRFPLLARLRREGGTDYVLRSVRFPAEKALIGLAVSLTSDAPGGFSKADLDLVERLLPVLGLASYRIGLSRLSREVLGCYLGGRTSRLVLDGEIRRGGGHGIRAAILFADIRGFTALSGRVASATMIGWLNDVLAAFCNDIEQGGGEILKFLGDGVLAIFPVGGDGDERAVCAAALHAASAGLWSVAAIGDAMEATGLPRPEIDVALHFGEVFYGNIGAARRLDFTVIGPVVNETARMEPLCDDIGVHLVLSGEMAARLSVPTRRAGHFRLKGVPGDFAVHTLEPDGSHDT